MQFRPWKPKGDKGIYKRFYLADGQKVFLSKSGSFIGITGGSASLRSEINIFLIEKDIILSNIGLRELNELMVENNLITFTKQKSNSSKGSSKMEFTQNTKTNMTLAKETMAQDPSTCKFKAPTRKNGFIIVDGREPKELFDKINKLGIDTIQHAHLELGDILIGDTRTKDVLLIERKVITDLSASIKSNHGHDQAERYFDKQQEMAALGYRMQVMWIVEGQDGGARMLYNGLPSAFHVDGWVSYIATIVGQQTVQSYNMDHTAYLVGKFAQGFIEKELFRKVHSGNPLINRKHEHTVIVPTSETSDHGVTRASNGLDALLSYIPSIKRNVATELAKLGKDYAEIMQMSVKELLDVKGVGKQSAQEIYNDFHTESK